MRNTPWLDEQPDGIIYAGSVLYRVKGKLPENSAVKVKEGTLSICNSAFCTESDENGADTGDKNLVSVTLPNGIRNIGSYAFCGCSNLKEINLPDSIRDLGYSTFEGCSSLENVHIPHSLEMINGSVFASCSSLKEVVIPKNIDYVSGGAFANCTSLKSLTVEGEHCYLDDPFGMQENHSDSGNTDFSGTIYGPVQSAVEEFAARHGYNFAVLDSTGTTPVKTASDGIWSWDEYSDHAEICGYQGDSEVLDIPAELNGLPVTAISLLFCMESPGHITGLKIPAGLTDIGDLPFYLERLKDAEIDENNKSFVLENGALYTADKSVLIKCLTDKVKGEFIVPAPVNIISNHAFANCTELTAVGLNASVTDFPNDLTNCSSLEAVNVSKRNERYVSRDGVLFNNFGNELVIYPRNREGNSYSVPNGTEKIRNMAFYDCDKLENIELPETLDTISYIAFENCDKLDNIVTPAKVNTIDERAFKNCKSLENITFSDNITYFGADVMTGTPWLEAQPDGPVYCGSALYTIKGDTAEVTVKDGTKCIADHCFVSAETDENGVTFINTNKTLKTVSLPDSIQRFGYMTFVNCEALTTVNIPKNLEKSAYRTFSGCSSLKNIILSDADREIGDNEYECCDSLTDVVIPENISSIGSGAFAGCASLSSVTIKNPDCEICLSPETISNSVQYGDNSEVTAAFSGTIYGYDGSTAEKYAKEYGYKFTSLGKTLPKGDVNDDGRINAVDASSVLYYYAMTSTSRDGGFTDVQKLAAEVNRDGTINAVDASCILAYYAYTSTTEFELVSLESFISRMN